MADKKDGRLIGGNVNEEDKKNGRLIGGNVNEETPKIKRFSGLESFTEIESYTDV